MEPVLAVLANAVAALLSIAGPLPATALSPPHFEVLECATCLGMLALARTQFSRQCLACGLMRVVALASGTSGHQWAAALVGLLDLAWTREQLFDLLIKSKSQLSWVVGASKACLVLDVNARLLEVLGLLSPVPDPGLFGWCWLRFVLVAMTLSTWLMARASPTYCVIMVLSLGAVMVASHLDPEGHSGDGSGLHWWILGSALTATGFTLQPWLRHVAG
ncbi:unnamed protein product [Symbiodinium natans]|uniref:Uncharacterized protein n=1 Tax=Symbiodinium natans TaxID=878477 RepID=A0A812SA18_9DINO|nr:unnamed protein product [Symbiodinium natans]